MKLAGFVGPAYRVQNKIAADDELYNWIPSKIESGTGPAMWVYDPAPGFQTYTTLPQAPTRGFFTLNGATFAVGGENLYELTVLGTTIERATGLSNVNNQPVYICGNGDTGLQLMIVSDSTLYCFELITNTLTAIADLSSGGVVFQDGYFISLDPSTSTIYLSALEDGQSWDPLDLAQRNDSPDKWITIVCRPKEVWLLGSQSTSVYYDDGNADFPYVPNPSVAIAFGTPAPYSVGLLNGSPIWLANDLVVRYANGYTPQRVSTHAVEYSISQMSTVLDADCITYTENGHLFYVLNFPTAGVTWVYDITTDQWHKRGYWNGLDFEVSPVWGYTFAFGKHLVGDRVTGAIYEMSQDFATDTDGTSGLRRVRRAPHLVQELKRVIYDTLQLHMEVGLGLSTGQGSNPKAMLRWSDDGGQSFGNVLEMGVGAVGQYSRRVIWRKLGLARDRVFEVSVTDPIPWRLVDAYIDIRAGAS